MQSNLSRNPLLLGFAVLTSLSIAPPASASPWMEIGESAQSLTSEPVLIARHEDGSREILPLSAGEGSEIGQPIPLWTHIKLSPMGGFEVTTLEGAALSVGIVVGERGDTLLGRIRSGATFEVAIGTDGAKAGLGWTVGSFPLVGLNVTATYLHTYGTGSLVPADQDLLGAELGIDATYIHLIVGALKSLQTGNWAVNAGAGIRFY